MPESDQKAVISTQYVTQEEERIIQQNMLKDSALNK